MTGSLLPLAEFAHNGSVCSSMQQTPFYAQYGFHPHDHPATPVVVQGFSPLSSRSTCICFLESIWKKQRLLTNTMQIVIGEQRWTLWSRTMFGCPVNTFVLCILLLSWTTIIWAHVKSGCVLSAPSMRSQYSPIVPISLLKPVHPDPFQWQPLPPSPDMV